MHSRHKIQAESGRKVVQRYILPQQKWSTHTPCSGHMYLDNLATILFHLYEPKDYLRMAVRNTL